MYGEQVFTAQSETDTLHAHTSERSSTTSGLSVRLRCTNASTSSPCAASERSAAVEAAARSRSSRSCPSIAKIEELTMFESPTKCDTIFTPATPTLRFHLAARLPSPLFLRSALPLSACDSALPLLWGRFVTGEISNSISGTCLRDFVTSGLLGQSSGQPPRQLKQILVLAKQKW